MSLFSEFTKGVVKENPIFRLVLGMCPTLAVTSTVKDGVGMGIAATFVLACSNVVISAIRNVVPSKVRIPCYIVVIAAFVTILGMLMQAFMPALYDSLGIFIPLIVVNCIILGRAEAFAAKNGIVASLADGLGMGLGFTLALGVVALVRSLVAKAALMAILPPGGFIILGALLAGINAFQSTSARRKGLASPEPLTMDCRSCALCKIGE